MQVNMQCALLEITVTLYHSLINTKMKRDFPYWNRIERNKKRPEQSPGRHH